MPDAGHGFIGQQSRRDKPPIFVTGVWKSGNHLIYSALNQLGVEGPFNGFAAHLVFGRWKAAKRVLRGAWPGVEAIDIGLETEARVRTAYLRHELRRLRGKIIGGHAAYSDALFVLLAQENARIIVIRRDPRDILVSFADWIGGRPDYFLHRDFADLSREARIERLLRGGAGNGYRLRPFAETLALAQPWLTAGDAVLCIAFEDIIGPNGGGSRDKQEQALAAIRTHLKLPVPDNPDWIDRVYGSSLTFNKGRVQRWRELASGDLCDEINERLRSQLDLWGYAPMEECHQ